MPCIQPDISTCSLVLMLSHEECHSHGVQGYDVAAHVLACFGGAGGQHACAIARALGMRTIFVHRFAGILSAVGIGLADVVSEAQVTVFSSYLSLSGAGAFAHCMSPAVCR